MDPGDVFRANLSLIDQVSSGVCRRARVYGADADDFASSFRLALMDRDYAILRQYQGRASLKAFLTIVADRMLLDLRTHEYGRWRPSAEATRLGRAALVLEELVCRDRRPLDEVFPHARAVDPALTREAAEAILARLPEHRTRPKPTDLETIPPDVILAADQTDARALEGDALRLSRQTSAVVREALATLPLEDRMLLRFRFASSMKISDISRMLRLPQRPLYRRLESLLGRLRSALAAASLDARELEELIGAQGGESMDFGSTFSPMENDAVRQSLSIEEPHGAARESS